MTAADLVDEIAPGLRSLPDTLSGVRSAFESGDLRTIADPGRIDSYVVLILVGGTIYLLVCVLVRQLTARFREKRKDDPAKEPEPPMPKMGGPGLFERWQFEQSTSVGGVTFDRKWRQVGIVATTGARKSTLLALLAEQLRVPFIVITGDHAPPPENLIRSRGGYVWKPRGDVSWYPWGGELEFAAQRAEHMHPATGNDVGVHRAAFKQAARKAWALADMLGIPRSLAQVRAVLPSVVRGQSTASMVENWTIRLLEIEESLGDSLGPGLDIVEALRAGRDVGIFLNSFQDVSNRQRFASIAVLEALRAADTLGNIGVVIDEVGLVGADLFGDAVRTFRARKVTGLFASQIASDFPEELRGNVNVWFLGQQSGGDKKSRQWSSDCTFGLVPPEAFGEHALPHGKFFVVAGGRVQRATVPTWKPRRERPAPPLDVSWAEPGAKNDPGGVVITQEQEPDRENRIRWLGRLVDAVRPKMLGAGKLVVPPWIDRISRRREHWLSLSGIEDEGACHLWTRGLNKGYGKAAYANASGWQAHFLFWAWKVMWDHKQGEAGDLDRFYMEYPDVPRFEWPSVRDELVLLRALKAWMFTWMETVHGRHVKELELSIDHACEGGPNTRCQNWRHLQLVTGGDNSRLRHARRNGAGRLAAEKARRVQQSRVQSVYGKEASAARE